MTRYIHVGEYYALPTISKWTSFLKKESLYFSALNIHFLSFCDEALKNAVIFTDKLVRIEFAVKLAPSRELP